MKEELKYNLEDCISKGQFLISVRPDVGFIVIIIINGETKAVIAQIKLTQSAFSKLCSDFVFSLAKYIDLEQKPDKSSPLDG